MQWVFHLRPRELSVEFDLEEIDPESKQSKLDGSGPGIYLHTDSVAGIITRTRKDRIMSTPERLLDDAGMRDFIVKGYHSFKLDLPPDYHAFTHRRTEEVFAGQGNPGNNLLPLIPELQQVLDHPRVRGTLASILGPEYSTHPHRHCHLNPPEARGRSFTRMPAQPAITAPATPW